MTESILIVVIILGAVGYLLRRAYKPKKHDCPDCAVSQHAAQVRKRRSRTP